MLAAALFFAPVNAQDNGVKRPSKGAVGLEVQFNPFSLSGETFSMDGLNMKFFLTDIDALRFKLGFNYNREKEKEISAIDGNFKFDVGYERHLPLAKRVDFYMGAQLGIEKGFARTKGTDAFGKEYLFRGASVKEDINVTGGDISEVFDKVNADNRAYTAFNITAMAGLDVYVYRGLYLGTELGFRIKTASLDNVKFKYSGVEATLEDGGFATNVGFYIDPSIRLGYTF